MSFARLAARLERRAAALARRRIAARRQLGLANGSHWRSAPYLWPLFGA